MNFALVLVILTAITGIISLFDMLYFSKHRKGVMPKWIEHARSFFPVFLAVLLFRSFLIEPFRIPSGSLEPTLLVGDFVAVNKFAYGIRVPVIEKKIFDVSHPKTGEIVVFRWPPDPALDYIKRVIGVPGDVVAYHDKKLYLNGKEMSQTFLNYETDPASGKTVARYQEDLNGVIHDIYTRPAAPAGDFEIKVPKNAYFVMGDNRDDSADSRYWGVVSDEYLRGKAFLTWMSWDSQQYMVRFNRIGRLIANMGSSH
jgi:signal peptidase I